MTATTQRRRIKGTDEEWLVHRLCSSHEETLVKLTDVLLSSGYPAGTLFGNFPFAVGNVSSLENTGKNHPGKEQTNEYHSGNYDLHVILQHLTDDFLP